MSSFPAHHYHMIIRKTTIFAINSLWALALKCFWCWTRNGRKLKAEKLAKALADSRTIDPNHCLHLFTPPPCDLGKNVVPSLENTKKLLQKRKARNEMRGKTSVETFPIQLHSFETEQFQGLLQPLVVGSPGGWNGVELRITSRVMGAWPKTHVDPARCFSSNKYGKPNKLCR